MHNLNLKMPKGYTLVRWGLFRWGWIHDADGHLSNDTKFTAKGAMDYALRHAYYMGKLAENAAITDCKI